MSKSKSQKVSSILLSILAVFNRSVMLVVGIFYLTKLFQFLFLEILDFLTTFSIRVTFIFHKLFWSMPKYRYLFILFSVRK